jgi:MYXO-CTERM domain-containing protein
MKNSLILSAVLALGLGISPQVGLAQTTDQNATMAPMATATVNPMATASGNPMATATAAPATNTYPVTTPAENGTGSWGLIGLLGLLGLFGMRGNRTTRIT